MVSGAKLAAVSRHECDVHGITFSSSGSHIVVTYVDHSVQVFHNSGGGGSSDGSTGPPCWLPVMITSTTRSLSWTGAVVDGIDASAAVKTVVAQHGGVAAGSNAHLRRTGKATATRGASAGLRRGAGGGTGAGDAAASPTAAGIALTRTVGSPVSSRGGGGGSSGGGSSSSSNNGMVLAALDHGRGTATDAEALLRLLSGLQSEQATIRAAIGELQLGQARAHSSSEGMAGTLASLQSQQSSLVASVAAVQSQHSAVAAAVGSPDGVLAQMMAALSRMESSMATRRDGSG